MKISYPDLKNDLTFYMKKNIYIKNVRERHKNKMNTHIMKNKQQKISNHFETSQILMHHDVD